MQERLLGRSRRVAVCRFPEDRGMGVGHSAGRSSLGVARVGAAGSGHRARGPVRSVCHAWARPTMSSRRRESRGSQTGRAFGSQEASDARRRLPRARSRAIPACDERRSPRWGASARDQSDAGFVDGSDLGGSGRVRWQQQQVGAPASGAFPQASRASAPARRRRARSPADPGARASRHRGG
jgi:hypothetical protein